MAKKPQAAAAPAAAEIPKIKTSKVNERHVAAVVDAVGHSLQKTFGALGYALIVFDKAKPDQTQHFAGGDRAACIKAMTAVSKKLGA